MQEFWGGRLGAATTFSAGRLTWDVLYALMLPEAEPGSPPTPAYLSDALAQVAGFALTADVGVGRSWRPCTAWWAAGTASPLLGWEGLEAALGADYTLGDWYLPGEYLFFGPGHVDWASGGLDPLYSAAGWEDLPPLDRLSLLDPAKRPQLFARHDSLFLLARWSAARHLSLGASCLAGLDDLSALLTVFAEYHVLHNLTLQLRFLQPVDRRLFDSGAAAGECGPTVLGFRQLLGLTARVRF